MEDKKTYSSKYPLKIITLVMDTEDRIDIVARYDKFNDAWYSDFDDVSFAISNAWICKNDLYNRIDIFIDHCIGVVEPNVRFYFGTFNLYSDSGICQHFSYKKIGDWKFKIDYKKQTDFDGNKTETIKFIHSDYDRMYME